MRLRFFKYNPMLQKLLELHNWRNCREKEHLHNKNSEGNNTNNKVQTIINHSFITKKVSHKESVRPSSSHLLHDKQSWSQRKCETIIHHLLLLHHHESQWRWALSWFFLSTQTTKCWTINHKTDGEEVESSMPCCYNDVHYLLRNHNLHCWAKRKACKQDAQTFVLSTRTPKKEYGEMMPDLWGKKNKRRRKRRRRRRSMEGKGWRTW